MFISYLLLPLHRKLKNKKMRALQCNISDEAHTKMWKVLKHMKRRGMVKYTGELIEDMIEFYCENKYPKINENVVEEDLSDLIDE